LVGQQLSALGPLAAHVEFELAVGDAENHQFNADVEASQR
jgi:hypothetical protein